MPIVLLVIGVIFLIAAVRGTQDDLFAVLKDDFTGPGNFIYWGISLFLIGAVGYYRPLKPVSNSFMLLVVLILFLSNRGFFQRFLEQIGQTQEIVAKRVTNDPELSKWWSGISSLGGGETSGSSNAWEPMPFIGV